jgi:protein-L-isoaspartate O-methyltransferase
MKKYLLYSLLAVFVNFSLLAQNNLHKIEFEHFDESKGDSRQELITELPYDGMVLSNIPLNSSSGLGKTFNFHGNMVVVERMERLNDGSIQVVLRREDNENFFGYKPTLKAVLKSPKNFNEETLANN